MHLKKTRRKAALFLSFLTLFQSIQVPVAYALTSGPTQPEVQSFEPAGTTEMVDLFTGDFTYNIPLFELPGPNGGYPFNLSYHAGIGMDQEASWVGLGWNLNPGAINRQMRGIPDEFNGDSVYTKMSMKPNITAGLGAGASVELFGGDLIKASVGFSVYNNNYKGIGHSLDGSLGFSMATNSGSTVGLGLSASSDSQNGLSLNPSLSLGNDNVNFQIGVGYNTKVGLSDISTGVNYLGVSDHFSLSLLNPGFTPQVGMPFKNLNLSAEFKAGGSWWGIFGHPYVRGFYNEQKLKNDKLRIPSPAYGYLNYQNAHEGNAMLDFNREKDGIVRNESPNLPIPSLTYDIYSLTGQGIASMYRPIRTDNGTIYDPDVESTSAGFSIGVDASPAASHVGVNLGVNHARSISGKWKEDNEISEFLEFQEKEINDSYEPWYFKVHGEKTAEPTTKIEELGGDEAVRVQLGGTEENPTANNRLERKTWNKEAPDNNSDFRERKTRGEVIAPLTNEQLLSDGGEIINLFKIQYLNSSGSVQDFNRNSLPKHHFAGITALNTAGLRYNYALPAYNHKQEETMFSAKKVSDSTTIVPLNEVNGEPKYDYDLTEEYLKITETPAYAHSYLLTSVVGPDYIDVDGNGVSEMDLGYWVKFTYQQMASKTDPYKWRAPFSEALLSEGLKTDIGDDKGSYTYGEKEIWYLARAETKTHIATFITAPREDGIGAVNRLQINNNLGKRLQALKEIRLFTRSAGSNVPLKVIKLEQDYSLCKGVDNGDSGQGKLTLKKLWFEYGTSKRGQLNPYIFGYNASIASENPSYDLNASDRWGNFKPYPSGDPIRNQEFPYTEQDPSQKTQIDKNVAVWSLKDIRLPSGGKIMVDYESDDYGYVQHLPAMQMMEIVGNDDPAAKEFNVSDNDLKIRFKLEKPITDNGTIDQRKEVLKYIDKDRKQLYFKIKINLRKASDPFHEYVSGYADINLTEQAGLMGLEKGGGTDFEYGYFHVLSENGHHPFSLRAWQHVRMNQPDIVNIGSKIEPTTDKNKMVNQIRSLGNVFENVVELFKGYYKYCSDKKWGREIVAEKSRIRLYSPDKIKYGGGLRVKQITMSDEWQNDDEGIYGQVYDYSILENGQIISSGVAANEPFNGGDENSLRYAKKYTKSVPLRSDDNLFFEFPVNESYYPGPGVGYRKVTVKSLAAAKLAGETLVTGNNIFPGQEDISYGTSGSTVHEFYTAKDFPVIANETEKGNIPYRLFVPVPLLGTITVSNLAATQGYSIVTNDMHGKPKRISNYRQGENGSIEPDPISWVQYNYLHEEKFQDGRKILSLKNTLKETDEFTVELLQPNDASDPNVNKFKLGQETEFFVDARQYSDETWVGGVRLNLDIVYIPVLVALVPIPILVGWPNVSNNSSQLRTVVTNKIIFETGVLESTEAYDGGSRVKTENLKWDKLTGRPVLTVVNNNFDDSVYTYHTPAYTQYQGMGAAYQNIGYTFELKNVDNLPYHDKYYQFTAGASEDLMFPGDEILLYKNEGEFKNPVGKITYVGEENGDKLLYSDEVLSDIEYKAMIVRSGYRNQLNVNAGSITALEDPSEKGAEVTYQKSLRIPVEK